MASIKIPRPLISIKRIKPATAAVMIVLLVWIWAGWQILTLMTDGLISTDALQAQQIRVKSGQLDQFITRVEAYQAGPSPKPVTAELFGPPSAGVGN